MYKPGDRKYRPFPNMTAPVLAWLPTRRKARLVDVRQLADGIGYTGKIGCTELRGTRQAERLVPRCSQRPRHLGRMPRGNHQGDRKHVLEGTGVSSRGNFVGSATFQK